MEAVVAGTEIKGRYRLDRPLDEGGMGVVWIAHDLVAKVDVAVKFIASGSKFPPKFMSHAYQRFAAEASIGKMLRGKPNVVQVLDSDTHGHEFFMVMELLIGITLSERLEGGPLSPRETVEVLAQAATGLAAAHKAGIVHRDLKPANVFLASDAGQNLVVKIIDFGAAKIAAQPLTAMGNPPPLTPYYAAPEQWGRDGVVVDERADIYAFGLIAYECLTAVVPVVRDADRCIPYFYQNGAPPPRSPDALPAGFEAWFRKACANDPGRRFPTIDEAADAFGRLFPEAVPEPTFVRESLTPPHIRPAFPSIHPPNDEGPPVPAVPSTPVSPPSAEPRPRRRKLLAICGGLVAAIAIVAVARLVVRRPRRDEPPPSFVVALPDGASGDGAPVLVQAPHADALDAPPATSDHEALIPAASRTTKPPAARQPASEASPAATCRPGTTEVPRRELLLARPYPRAQWLPFLRPLAADAPPITVGPLCMDERVVSAADYGDCMERERCEPPAAGCDANLPAHPDYAMNCVSWEDAASYCRFKGGQLPTIAEWEAWALTVKDDQTLREREWAADSFPPTVFAFGCSPGGQANCKGHLWREAVSLDVKRPVVDNGGRHLELSWNRSDPGSRGRVFMAFRCRYAPR